jgi:predicted restriction endonuclease
LDLQVHAFQRAEQKALKKALWTGPKTFCELCGRDFPAEFPTAAHIKRRQLCSDDEKNQLTAVAMLNCRFGCDELFGKGYVGVDESGTVHVSDALVDPVALDYATRFLSGQEAPAWRSREQTRPYFAFHHHKDFRRSVKITN